MTISTCPPGAFPDRRSSTACWPPARPAVAQSTRSAVRAATRCQTQRRSYTRAITLAPSAHERACARPRFFVVGPLLLLLCCRCRCCFSLCRLLFFSFFSSTSTTPSARVSLPLVSPTTTITSTPTSYISRQK